MILIYGTEECLTPCIYGSLMQVQTTLTSKSEQVYDTYIFSNIKFRQKIKLKRALKHQWLLKIKYKLKKYMIYNKPLVLKLAEQPTVDIFRKKFVVIGGSWLIRSRGCCFVSSVVERWLLTVRSLVQSLY